MTQYARPASDTAAGSWTTTPLWSKINDTAATGDGTTISSDTVGNGANTTNYDFALTNITDPSVATGHIMHMRAASSNARDITVFFDLYEGTPATGTLIATDSVLLVDATEVTVSYTLTGGEANSITDYTNLFGRLRGTGSGGGPNRGLVIDVVWFECPDAGTLYQQSISGSLTSSGSMLGKAKKLLAGSLSLAGGISKKITIPGIVGSLPSAGSVSRKLSRSISGILNSSGVLSAQLVVQKAIEGVLSLSGDISIKIHKLLSGSVSSSGGLVRKTSTSKTGSLLPTSDITKSTQRGLSGLLSTSGDNFLKVLKVLTGTLNSSSILSSVKGGAQQYVKSLIGAISASGVVQKTSKRDLAGTLSVSGSIQKNILKLLEGVLTASGNVSKQITISLVGVLPTVGSINKRIKRTIQSVLNFLGVATYPRPPLKAVGEIFYVSAETRFWSIVEDRSFAVQTENRTFEIT